MDSSLLKSKLTYFILMALGVASCTFSVSDGTVTETFQTTIQSGKSIPSDLRNEMDDKNAQIISALKEGDVEGFEKLASSFLIGEDGEALEGIVNQCSVFIRDTAFSVFGEHYSQSSVAGSEVVINSAFGEGDTNNFEFKYRPNEKDAYLSLLTKNAGDMEMLISNLFCEREGGFELDYMSVGNLNFLGHSGPEWYYYSQVEKEKGDRVNAFLFSQLSISCLSPCADMFVYDSHHEIKNYCDSIKEEFNIEMNYPILLDDLSSKPSIVDFGIGSDEELNLFPFVAYTSSLGVLGEDAVSIERKKIDKQIDKIFPNIRKYFSLISYRLVDV